MTTIALWTLAAAAAFVVYTFVGYPALLGLLGAMRRRPETRSGPVPSLPSLSITVPAFNEERHIGPTLDALLAMDYPADRRQILVVSDASTDRTDEIVRSYADRGVELFRTARRGGKDAAENAVRHELTGDIVLNTDASVRLHPDAARHLVAAFADPTVGVASGRDISVAATTVDANPGESGYVGYEMWVRRLETRAGGIVGASGCLYAIRRDLHRTPLPEGLNRDFASALIAREAGFRAVSVDAALCFVPRTTSLHREFRRKTRTVSRGLRTLRHKRHLLNPLRHGRFAWMLFSHKLCRWLLPWAFLLAGAAILAMAPTTGWARAALLAGLLSLALAGLGWRFPTDRPLPRVLGLPSYFVIGNVATLIGWFRLVRGRVDAVWEPTRRETVDAAAR